MRTHNDSACLARGVLAGALGGLVASWVMNLFITAVMKAQHAANSADEHASEHSGQQKQQDSEDSTMKVADAVVWLTTGHHLSNQGKQKGGPIVHYAFGTLMGALYGAVAELSHTATAGAGTAFGSVLFIAADEVMVPALGLSKPPAERPASDQLTHYAAHVVYGASTEMIRRLAA